MAEVPHWGLRQRALWPLLGHWDTAVAMAEVGVAIGADGGAKEQVLPGHVRTIAAAAKLPRWLAGQAC